MAFRSFNRTLGVPLARQLNSSCAHRRSWVSALGNARNGALVPAKSPIGMAFQPFRGMKTIDFAGHKETVYGMLQQAKSNHLY